MHRTAKIALLVASALASGFVASEETTVPKGIPAGPWVLAPSIVIGYDYDTNVFSTPDEAGPLSDYSFLVEPSLVATLPFRNSYAEFSYKASWNDYGKAFPDAQVSQQGEAKLSLLFSTQDRLTVDGNLIFGVAKTETFDPGGEVLYNGSSFQLANESISLVRATPGRRGYRLALGHNALDYDQSEDLLFFSYDGWTADAEYGEPLRQNVWFVAAYNGSRYDHFCPNFDPLGNPCPPPSTPYRRELSNSAYLGLRGTLGGHEPFLIRAGWSNYTYQLQSVTGFQGLTVEANLAIPIGGGTDLRLGVTRRPYPSYYFNCNYYLVDRIDAGIEHAWRNQSTLGLRTSYWTSRYSDPIDSPGFPQNGIVREDRSLRGELYATLLLVGRFGFTFSVARQDRDSNIDSQGYSGTSYFAGLTYDLW